MKSQDSELNDDGLTIQFRGGCVRAPQWEKLADVADEFGDSYLQLTAQGNIELPEVSNSAAAVGFLQEHGLAVTPTPSVLRSPLALDLDGLINDLYKAALSNSSIARISHEVLFGIDAGEGSIIGERPDFGLIATTQEHEFQLVLGGTPTGLLVERSSAVPALMDAVDLWSAHWKTARRISENSDTIPTLVSYLKDSGLISGQCPALVPEPGEAKDIEFPRLGLDSQVEVAGIMPAADV